MTEYVDDNNDGDDLDRVMEGNAARFEDLRIWRESRIRVTGVYRAFHVCGDFAFRDQIHRAALSVMNNIAEGFERHTRRDFARFLDQAKGSCGEVRSVLYAAEDLQMLSPEHSLTLRHRSERLSKSIGALLRHLRGNSEKE